MAKKRRKRRSKGTGHARIDWGGPAAKATGRLNLALLAAAVLVVAGLGYFWWQNRAVEREFLALAQAGRGALARVQSFPNNGRRHLQPGESYVYGTSFPTSGPHDPNPTRPGVYDAPQRPTQLVHALEHGNIVIYTDQPGDEVLARLEDWAGLYDGRWDGLVVASMSGLGDTVVLTAWRKSLVLERFDPAAAAAFIDAHRGRGPERPVR